MGNVFQQMTEARRQAEAAAKSQNKNATPKTGDSDKISPAFAKWLLAEVESGLTMRGKKFDSQVAIFAANRSADKDLTLPVSITNAYKEPIPQFRAVVSLAQRGLIDANGKIASGVVFHPRERDSQNQENSGTPKQT